MASPQVGAWEIVSETCQGLAIFTETRHCMVKEEDTRRALGTERPTEAESAHLYQALRADAGTDAVSQSGDEWILTQHIAVAKGPDAVGRDIRIALKFDGDTFSTHTIRPDGTKQAFFVFRKGSDLGSSSISGMWEDATEDWNGLMILTDTHYAQHLHTEEPEAFSRRSTHCLRSDGGFPSYVHHTGRGVHRLRIDD